MHDEVTKEVCCWRCNLRQGVPMKSLHRGGGVAFLLPPGWAVLWIDIESTVVLCGGCYAKEEEEVES